MIVDRKRVQIILTTTMVSLEVKSFLNGAKSKSYTYYIHSKDNKKHPLCFMTSVCKNKSNENCLRYTYLDLLIISNFFPRCMNTNTTRKCQQQLQLPCCLPCFTPGGSSPFMSITLQLGQMRKVSSIVDNYHDYIAQTL